MLKILNMNTIQLGNNTSVEQYQMAVRVLKAIGLKVITNEKEEKPNKLTLEAMKEAESIIKLENKRKFRNAEELLSSLND